MEKKFIDLVNTIKPDQVTLVPDSEDAITSNAGWNTINNYCKGHGHIIFDPVI